MGQCWKWSSKWSRDETRWEMEEMWWRGKKRVRTFCLWLWREEINWSGRRFKKKKKEKMYNHQSVFWYTCELHLFLCVSMSKIQWEWVLVSYEFIECFPPLFYMVVSRDAINFIGDRGSGGNNKKMGLCSKKHKLLMSEEETGSQNISH